MAKFNLPKMLCDLPMISSPKDIDGEVKGVNLPLAFVAGTLKVDCLLFHVYDPILDIRIYAADILTSNSFHRLGAILFLVDIFGQDSYVSSQNRELDFWLADCDCRPQSPFHLKLGNKAIDTVYNSHQLPLSLYHSMDRILCLGYQPDSEDVTALYKALQLNEEDKLHCLSIRTTLLQS